EAGFLEFSDAVATGSSLMPQKKNPDAMELIRGKAGRVAGHLNAMLMTLKGLPLAYNKDMQEDKEGLFDAIDTCSACLKVAATAAENLRFDAERCREACSRGFLDSTDLADLLVAAGVPFRDAHERVGIAVRQSIKLGVELRDLPKAVQEELFPEIDKPLAKELSIEKVLGRRKVIGGTAPTRVRQETKRWQKKLTA
ncbi:MAG: lyase family protein, partial [Planctomycetota bacterium]